MSWNVEQT